MNNLDIIILMVNNFVWIGAFLYFKERNDKQEKSRFREFVLAIKAEGLQDYAVSLPDDQPIEKKEPDDELIDLDQVEPGRLLDAIKNENQ